MFQATSQFMFISLRLGLDQKELIRNEEHEEHSLAKKTLIRKAATFEFYTPV